MNPLPTQADLFAAPAPPEPQGLVYVEDLISAVEEADLVARFATLPFEAFDFQGFKGNRRVVYFGWSYDFSRGRVAEAPAIPDWIVPLRARAAALAGVEGEALVQLLINEYRPGAGIGWHRDRPQFGKVVGVSLGAPAVMRFRRPRGDGGWVRAARSLAPRSAYLLDGPAREEWQHSILPGERTRWSATFRTLRATTV